jgi:CheY-like chemotaxis protein
MAKLIVTTKALSGLSFELGAHWITIGRAATNAFQILEASVSGQHCEVLLKGKELQVRDMRSTNGTFIKGVMITEGVVMPGDVLRLGDVELRFEKSPLPQLTPKISISVPGYPEKAAVTALTATNRKEEMRASKKQQILLVDDSMAFLETLSEMFEVLSDKTWEIHKAASADQALAILQQHQIELAVLDINMPMLDGVQLLGVIQRRHPDVKKIVLTAHATDTHRAQCLANGAELFLEKPVTPDGIVSVFNLLNDLFVWSQREGFSGTLRQVGLTDVIQIECLRRSSCILEVHNPETSGAIYIESGAIVHATAAVLTGAPALYQLLSMSNGQFRLQPFKSPGERTIEGSWEYLLMEAARMRDEAHTVRASEDTVVIPKSPATPKPATPAPAPPANTEDTGYQELGDDIVVVSTYDGDWHPVEGSKKP